MRTPQLERSPRRVLPARSLVSLTGALLIVACGGDSGGGDTTDSDADTSPPVSCLSSAGCDQEAGHEGQLCVDSECVACTESADCQADEHYGSETVCDNGACVACLGVVGCPCDGDSCSSGTCMSGTCADCTAGEVGCACDAGMCSPGGRCDDSDVCVTCPDGEEGCPCGEDDACDGDLECTDDLCVGPECTPGTLDCPCDGDSCDDELYCGMDTMCHTCNADGVGCVCSVSIGCSNDLICDTSDKTCREPVACSAICAEHQACTQEDGEDPVCVEACDGDYVWNDSTQSCDAIVHYVCDEGEDPEHIADDCAAANRTCVEATDDEAAYCGDCVEGTVLVEETQSCRGPLTCEDLASTCDALHRGCIEGGVIETGGEGDDTDAGDSDADASDSDADAGDTSDGGVEVVDAYCGACVVPYLDNGDTGLCEVDPSADCADGGSNSLYAECTALHRSCDDPDDAAPSCGDCETPYVERPDDGLCDVPQSCAAQGCPDLGRECDDSDLFPACGECKVGLTADDPDDPSSACHEAQSCSDLDCGDGYCTQTSSLSDASCIDNPCADGQAWNPSSEACVTCTNSCTEPGQTGRYWLYTRDNGTCTCETEDGWYIDTTLASLPAPCDADGDGWVRTSAEPFANDADDAIRDNWRCNVRTIDRIELHNEWQQTYVVYLCADPIGVVGQDETCYDTTGVSLYEPTVLDDTSTALSAVDYPALTVSGEGRQLRNSELNPLTKACVTATGDFNDNGIADVTEADEMVVPSGVTLSETQGWLLNFGYFIELGSSWYEDRLGESHGQLVIAERSRCETADAGTRFALGFDEANGSDYWKQCTRNRRASFDRSSVVPGNDFARWGCTETSGSCDAPTIPTSESVVDTVPAHGLCELSLPPLDGVWRGMNHHSQFRCVSIVSGTATEDYELSMSAIYDKSSATSGSYQFNDCAIDCPDDDPSCASDCGDDGCATSSATNYGEDQPSLPVLSCAQTLPTAATVGFVGVRYVDGKDHDAYTEGCIDEWLHWPGLCPGYDTSLPADEQQSAVGDGDQSAFGQLICGCGVSYAGTACSIGCADADLMLSADYAQTPAAGYWLCGDLGVSVCTEDSDGGERPVCETPEQIAEDSEGRIWTLEAEVTRFGIAKDLLYQTGTGCDDAVVDAGTRGSPLICGYSICLDEVSWADAKAACEDAGHRLCTRFEVETDETRGTGCSYDSQLIWTSTACDGGYYAVVGATTSDTATQCVAADDDETAFVRCCDTTYDSDGWTLQ